MKKENCLYYYSESYHSKGEILVQYNTSVNGYNITNRLKLSLTKKATDKNGNIITELIYDSKSEASRKFNIHPSGISMCCTGKRKTANGYHWEYID